MEAFLGFNAIYLLTSIPLACIIFLIFRFGFKVTKWYLTDLIVVLLPGTFYTLLYITRLHRLLGNSKTLGNLTELVFIGIGCGLIFLLRAIFGKKFPNYSRRFSLGALLLIIILTVGVYIFTPALPE